ncbi:EcsC family protein [Chitinasiproducens palmae]|uniref:EcsC protein family protein n=1 Tax=Chitinasiproducens palmae TaxID=1770053 RepID=A0A1H2PNC0_9BURK|nr:EcsC family protein [Chitinasiproducens palmae]SDV48183.1 EcsC protein family protein [Chitinasiproducens palmae]
MEFDPPTASPPAARAPGAADLSAGDLATLADARARLESPGLALRLANAVGAPFDRLLARLPAGAHEIIASAARKALDTSLQLAIKTAGRRWSPLASPRLHTLAVAGTGAAGGAFGLAGLPVELPVTTTLMFRSICEIARQAGENLDDPAVRLECLLVFAMGGPSRDDDDASFGYFVVRGAMAQMVGKAAGEMLGKGVFTGATGALARLSHAIASRFAARVGEQVAAKSVPALGAVLGATINTVFINHFQQIARGHFAIRQLERRYGQDAVRQAYDRLA